MQTSKIKYVQSKLETAKLNYDCVICESDVIWSPGFSGGHFDKSFFLALESMSNTGVLGCVGRGLQRVLREGSSEQSSESRECMFLPLLDQKLFME